MKSFETRAKELQEKVEENNEEKSDLLKEALELISNALDENNALWLMIDEQKSSEIERFSHVIKAGIDEKINEILLLSKSKIVDC